MSHFALDIENVGDRITLIGVSSPGETWASEWNMSTKAEVTDILRNSQVKVAHNWSHELSYFDAYGIEVADPIFDTMLAGHLLQPDLHKALEKMVPLYVDARPFKHLPTTIPARPAHDAYFTRRIYEKQVDLLRERGMYDLFTKVIMPAHRTLMAMTKRGIKVDIGRMATWQAELAAEEKDLLEKWYRMTGDVNPNSNPAVAKLLYNELKMKKHLTRSHRAKVDEETLNKLIAENPKHADLLRTLLDLRGVRKLISTYSNVALGDDLCVHPRYLPMGKDTDSAGAATGRVASNGPNIQNQPPVARKLYVPHHSGWGILEADYSQAELRIAAYLSGDTGLRSDLESGDVFGSIMRVLGCDRVRTKNVVYGSLYGAGPRKLADVLKAKGTPTSFQECKDFQDRLARAYPRLWGWRASVVTEAAARKYLVNPFGRRRYFFSEAAAPQAMDFLPQSTVADIMWTILPQLEAGIHDAGGALLTTVHDSIVAEYPPDKEDAVRKVVLDIMQQPWPQVGEGFFLPTKTKTGPSWGEVS